MAQTKTKIAITIDSNLLKDIDRICKAEGRTRSAFMERAMKDAVGEALDVVKALSNPVLADAFAKALGDPKVLKEMFTAMGEKVPDKDVKLVNRAVDGVVSALRPESKKRRG